MAQYLPDFTALRAWTLRQACWSLLVLAPASMAWAQTFTELSGVENPLNGLDAGDFSMPALADLDDDGDLDMITGKSNGQFTYYRNNGTATLPSFVLVAGPGTPMNGQDIGNESSVALVDINNDGDYDLFAGERDGIINFFRNEGTAAAPSFVLRLLANPFLFLDLGSGTAPVFGDIDSDGDFDGLIGESDGTLNMFQNTGTAGAPTFTALTGFSNPFNGIDVGSYSTPYLVDTDGDGDLDCVIGNEDGTLSYYENTGTPFLPSYTARTGTSNPFNGIDIGQYAAPSFADLDNDGDADLVLGRGDGTFSFYQNNLINFPVEFLGFEAVQVRQVVQLTWQTASELHNEGFTVMRSADGRIWERLGFVPGYGTTTSVQSYRFEDTRLAFGQVYYRLEQRDLDGTTAFSNTVELYVEPVAAAVSVYPNPAPGGKLIIQIFSSTDDRAAVSVLDMAGRTVYQQTVTLQAGTTFSLPADLGMLPRGLYQVMILTDEHPHMVQVQIN